MSADLEGWANSLRKEALQCLTVALAGSDTCAFWDLLTTYFRTNPQAGEHQDPWNFIDGAPAIPPPLPLTDTDTEDEARSIQSAPPASTPVVRPKRKLIAPTRLDLFQDICLPRDAIRVYPWDEDSINETGVPPELLVKREQRTTHSGASMYVCVHKKCQSPPFFSQSPAGLYSHVCRKHIGVVLACPYCPSKVYWNTKGWKGHMETKAQGRTPLWA